MENLRVQVGTLFSINRDKGKLLQIFNPFKSRFKLGKVNTNFVTLSIDGRHICVNQQTKFKQDEEEN